MKCDIFELMILVCPVKIYGFEIIPLMETLICRYIYEHADGIVV
jgi:hypothetical protein